MLLGSAAHASSALVTRGPPNTGSGGKKDAVRAAELWQKSSELGDPEAAATYGKILMEGAPGVEKDQAKACKHLRRAAEAGDPDCMYRLGNAYKNGLGVNKSDEEAGNWFRKAQQAGYVTPEQRTQQGAALYQQAVVFYTGQGVQRDVGKAIQLFVAAAQRGHPVAAGNLANFFLAGLPFPGMEEVSISAKHLLRALSTIDTCPGGGTLFDDSICVGVYGVPGSCVHVCVLCRRPALTDACVCIRSPITQKHISGHCERCNGAKRTLRTRWARSMKWVTACLQITCSPSTGT